MIKLYGISTSRAGRCVWALEEIGLEYEQIELHFNDGSTRTPEYRAINPNERIPTLVDGELVLYESMAINHYLADRYDGGLAPDSADDRARALMWSFWANNEVENLIRPLLRNRLFLQEADGVSNAKVAEGRNRCRAPAGLQRRVRVVAARTP